MKSFFDEKGGEDWFRSNFPKTGKGRGAKFGRHMNFWRQKYTAYYDTLLFYHCSKQRYSLSHTLKPHYGRMSYFFYVQTFRAVLVPLLSDIHIFPLTNMSCVLSLFSPFPLFIPFTLLTEVLGKYKDSHLCEFFNVVNTVPDIKVTKVGAKSYCTLCVFRKYIPQF